MVANGFIFAQKNERIAVFIFLKGEEPADNNEGTI
jgi:hypothetical protein